MINHIISEYSKIAQKEYKTGHDFVSKGIHWEFEIQTDHLISTSRPDLIIISTKEKPCRIKDFSVPANHGVKLKKCEKRDKYLDLARELKKLLKTKGTFIPNVTGALGTVTKWFIEVLEDLEIREPVQTAQTTALLRSARILRRVLETWGNLLSLKLQWKTIS